jgi:hypothetical protein
MEFNMVWLVDTGSHPKMQSTASIYNTRLFPPGRFHSGNGAHDTSVTFTGQVKGRYYQSHGNTGTSTYGSPARQYPVIPGKSGIPAVAALSA